MVNESISLQSAGLELASFGEVLYAFSTLRSTSGHRRGARAASELLPWEAVPGVAPECDAPPEPRKPAVPAPPRVDPVPQARAANCQENARWERIFQEKFANSDYYHHDIRIRYASPLSSV
jgi:hypothetical protein